MLNVVLSIIESNDAVKDIYRLIKCCGADIVTCEEPMSEVIESTIEKCYQGFKLLWR